jgi:hypothetical protein
MIDNYEILPNGVIHQKEIVNKIKDYDKEYVDTRYNNYGEKGMQMAYLRLGYLIGVVKKPFSRVLDVGYGNGDFLKACMGFDSINAYGNDISGYPIPKGATFVEDITSMDFDVVCFFDSLEHFEDISFVKDLKTKYVYISLPWCHNFSDDWFKNWKHRREDEHLWHFDNLSLENFMNEMGYDLVTGNNVEDAIRKPVDNHPNILTAIFEKV